MDAEPVTGEMVEPVQEPVAENPDNLPAPLETLSPRELANQHFLDTLSTWVPTPTMAKLLIERSRDRLCADAEVAKRVGITPTHLSLLRRQQPFRQMYDRVRDSEESSVLLLLHFMPRAACRTIYDALNGAKTFRGPLEAARQVLDAAERHSDPRRRSALPTLD